MAASRKRYAVLLCADDSEYVKKKYGGYFGVFVRMLAEEGEAWDLYRVAANEFPSPDEEIGKYDGFVITGSCSDAHGNDLWILRLIAFIRKLDTAKKRVLGICFGHQILGRALGGKVGRALSGWDIGVTTIHFSASSSKLFPSIKVPSSLSVIECHQDEVWELPQKAEVIARSDHTGIEMFRYDDHIMGIQGHPEYNEDILLHLIDRHCLHQKNIIVAKYADRLRTKLESQSKDREAWRKICVGFLKGRL